jgi:hypothetical protein
MTSARPILCHDEVIDAVGADPELIIEAADNCPVSAITVVDADTDEQLSPSRCMRNYHAFGR